MMALNLGFAPRSDFLNSLAGLGVATQLVSAAHLADPAQGCLPHQRKAFNVFTSYINTGS
jgi:hypothetical protein